MKKITKLKYVLISTLLGGMPVHANDVANPVSFDLGARVVQRSLEVDGNTSNFNDLDGIKKQC
jgi:hypothetical protein